MARQDADVPASPEAAVPAPEGDVPAPPEGDVPADDAPARAREEIQIDQPGKLLRIAVMVREMLEEVRRAPLDEDAREHLSRIHERVMQELRSGLSGSLAEELERITLPFDGDEVPSEAELRIAHAQLLGWLEGLFQGIQAAIATQQMAMASQLEEMRRRALPPGADPRERSEHLEGRPGQYL